MCYISLDDAFTLQVHDLSVTKCEIIDAVLFVNDALDQTWIVDLCPINVTPTFMPEIMAMSFWAIIKLAQLMVLALHIWLSMTAKNFTV